MQTIVDLPQGEEGCNVLGGRDDHLLETRREGGREEGREGGREGEGEGEGERGVGGGGGGKGDVK